MFIPLYIIIMICLFNMYMYVIMCIYVYGPVAVNTINELNWIGFDITFYIHLNTLYNFLQIRCTNNALKTKLTNMHYSFQKPSLIAVTSSPWHVNHVSERLYYNWHSSLKTYKVGTMLYTIYTVIPWDQRHR